MREHFLTVWFLFKTASTCDLSFMVFGLTHVYQGPHLSRFQYREIKECIMKVEKPLQAVR